MEKENKADLCSVLVKLGLAVMSVAYPQTGSQASLASAGVDVVLSVVKSVGLLKGNKRLMNRPLVVESVTCPSCTVTLTSVSAFGII